jgi:hypothetical protein
MLSVVSKSAMASALGRTVAFLPVARTAAATVSGSVSVLRSTVPRVDGAEITLSPRASASETVLKRFAPHGIERGSSIAQSLRFGQHKEPPELWRERP